MTFSATVEAPPNTGTIVAAEWDFEGTGNDPVKAVIDTPSGCAILTTTYAFSRPGTYFPVLRATSQRQGDAATPYAQVRNLGRVRIVVR